MMKINRFLFYIPILVFALVLIITLIKLSKIVYFFPSADYSGHLTNLYFLKEYGFHNLAPNWYNVYGGEYVLRFYPPLLSFYSLIFYSIIDNIQLAFYISIILIFVIGLIGIFILGKILNFSIKKRLFFFFFFYSNPVILPWFYIIGRIPEMLAWTFSFYLLALIFFYKDKQLDKKFYLFAILIFLLAFIFFIGFFIVRNLKDKLKIALSLIFVPLLSSFWLIDFLKYSGTLQNYMPGYRIYLHPTELIYSIFMPLAFFVIFFLCIKTRKLERKDKILFMPAVLIAIMYITHLFNFLPVFKSIEPRTYTIFLIILSLLLVLNLKINKKIEAKIAYFAAILSIIIVIATLIRYDTITNLSLYNEKNKDILSILPNVKQDFIAIGETSYDMNHVYSIAAVKYNLKTPFGWGIQGVRSDIVADKDKIKKSIEGKNCNDFNGIMQRLNVREFIIYKDKCNFLKSCNIKEIQKTGNYCHLSY